MGRKGLAYLSLFVCHVALLGLTPRACPDVLSPVPGWSRPAARATGPTTGWTPRSWPACCAFFDGCPHCGRALRPPQPGHRPDEAEVARADGAATGSSANQRSTSTARSSAVP